MEVILYEEKYKPELEALLLAFSEETFGESKADIGGFIQYHWAIYLVIQDEKVIAFSSFNINGYFGMRDATLGNDYIYVVPEKRGSRAMYLLSIQSGKICVENNLALEHYYSSDSSFKLSSKLKGKTIYEARIYEAVDVKETFGKLIKKVRIK